MQGRCVGKFLMHSIHIYYIIVLYYIIISSNAIVECIFIIYDILKRKQKDSWHQARAVATMHNGEYAMRNEMKKTTSGEKGSVVAIADNELSFRAMDGCNDGIRYDVPCGFDVRQLEILFPEEMGAYQRWQKVCDLCVMERRNRRGEEKDSLYYIM